MKVEWSMPPRLVARGEEPMTVFGLLGRDENSATYALGWTFSRCATFFSMFVQNVVESNASALDASVLLQQHAEDGGYTDVELRAPNAFHVIIEAKKGWEIPSTDQLRRYLPRFDGSGEHVFVSVSAAEGPTTHRLPPRVGNVPCKHLSWRNVQALAEAARTRTRNTSERLWLAELTEHLWEYVAMDRLTDNRVYVVALSHDIMREGGRSTWIDVVERDRAYFHPVGERWPSTPLNYIGFRYDGRLQSIHHIESSSVLANVSSINPEWVETSRDHFVYQLGPPMRPPREMRTGPGIHRGRHVSCMFDTLLSGACATITDAEAETKRRLGASP
jgi:hypothetical protein